MDLFGQNKPNNPNIPDFGSDTRILPCYLLWKCELWNKIHFFSLQFTFSYKFIVNDPAL